MLKDVLLAARSLRRSPGFALAAIATLALGLGANAAIFSVVDAVIWRSGGGRHLDRVVQVFDRYAGGRFEGSLSFPAFRDYAAATDVFARWGGLYPDRIYRQSPEGSQQVTAVYLSSDLFATLGARTQLGRPLGADEDADVEARAVVVSDGFWRDSLGADPSVVGRSLPFQLFRSGHRGETRGWQEVELTVVGVLEPGFALPPVDFGSGLRGVATEVVLPFGMRTWGWANRGMYGLVGVGTLREGVSLEQARARLAAIAAGAREADASSPVVAVDAVSLPRLVRDRYWAGLRLLWAGAAFLLTIGMANLGSLMLARGAARASEMAIYRALGGSRWRIVRRVLAEGLLIGLVGAGIGLFIALALIRTLKEDLPGRPIGLEQASLDVRAFGFALALSMAAVVVASLPPALRASRAGIARSIRAGRNDATVMRLLIAGEVAIAFVLLAGAGLMVLSFRNLVHVDPGVSREGVLVARFETAPYRSKYGSGPRYVDLVEQLVAEVEALPGVVSAGATDRSPLASGAIPGNAEITVADRPAPAADEDNTVTWSYVSPGAFETLGMRLRAGRLFDSADLASFVHQLERPRLVDPTPAERAAKRRSFVIPVVVSESLVKRYWPNGDGLGEIFYWGRQEPSGVDDSSTWDKRYPEPYSLQIVGVVGDVKVGGLLERTVPQFYTLGDRGLREIVVRTEGPPEELAEAVRAKILDVDRAELSVPLVETMSERFERASAETRAQMLLVVMLAAASLLLATIGMVGVLTYQLTRRRWEIGVRKALGARAIHVTRLVMRQGLSPVLLGIAVGFAGALGLTRGLNDWLVAVSPLDPVVLAGSAPMMLGLPVLVCVWSAHWANRLDPSRVLRSE